MSLTDPVPTVLHVGEPEPPDPGRFPVAERVLTAEGVVDALATIEEAAVDCVVVDAEAVGVARHVRERHPTLPLVVRTDAGLVTVATGDLPGMDGLEGIGEIDGVVGRGGPADGKGGREPVAGTDRSEGNGEVTLGASEILEGLEDGVYALDTDLRFVAVNDALAGLTGYDRTELLGEHVSLVVDESVVEAARDRLDALERDDGEHGRRFEIELRRADGDRRPVEAGFSPVESAGGLVGVVGVLRDVTRRNERRRERELWESMVDTVTDGLYALDGDRNIIAASEGFARLVGRDLESLVGEHVSVCVEESTIEENVEERRAIMDGDLAYAEWEFDVLRPDGERVPVENRYTGLPTEEGLYGTAGVMRDITERRERERALELRQAMVDAVSDGLYALDGDRNIVVVNEAFAELTGRDVESLVGEQISVCIDDSVIDETDAERRAVLDGEIAYGQHEFDLVGPDGDRTPVELRYTAFPDSALPDSESLSGTTGVMRDITERRERERELRLKDRVIEAADVGIAIADATEPDEPLVYVNPAFERITGYESEDALGRNCRFLQGPETDPESVAAVERAIDDRESVSVELLNHRSDGTWFWNQLTLTPVEDASGTVTHFIAFQQDVTERRERERALADLHDWTRRMVRAEDVDEVIGAAAGAVRALFEGPGTGVYTLDGASGELVLVDSTVAGEGGADGDGRATPDELPPSLADGPVWDAFVSGEARTPTEATGGTLTDTPDAGLIYPLGTYGAVVVGRGGEEPVPRDRRELVAVLAANAETALERATAASRLRDHDRRLTERNEELARLDRTNAVIRGVHRALVSEGSREAGRAAVADWLTDAEPYALAWFARVTRDGADPTVEPVVGGGDAGREYVDAVRDRLDGSPLAALIIDAAATHEIRTRGDVLGSPDWSALRPDALAHGYRSVAAIPITVAGRVDGVLVIHGTDPEAFPRTETEVLSELGGLIGRTLRAVDRAGVGSPDHRVAVEIGIPGRGLVFSRIAAEVGVPVTLEGSVPLSDGTVVSFVSAPVEGGRLARAFGAKEAVSEVTVIDDAGDDDGALVELRKPNCHLTTLVHDAGGRLHSVTATADGASATLDLPPDAGVRTVLEAIDTAYPGTTLRSRREVLSSELPRTVRAALRDRCTDRQYEALTGAYYSGYYDWPRRTTAADLADRAGVSSPTFQRHLRVGERRLLDIVLGA